METDDNNCQATKRPKISEVWNHFKLDSNKKHATCLRCHKIYKTSGNTTNLNDHLKRCHPLLLEGTKRNVTIQEYFRKEDSYDKTDKRKAVLDSALTKMIALDMQPFRIVEDKGFQNFVHCLDPRYKLPSRTTLQTVHLQKPYDEVGKKLQTALDLVESCVITTDCWSSKANESFLTVTCHFIDNDFKLQTAVLTTSKLCNELNHSSENIAESLRLCLNNWNIFHKVNYIVTDNAASMLKSCELLKKKNLPCFAHAINLVVQDALSTDTVKQLLAKCKRIVTYFKSSTIAYAKLRQEQGENQYSLIQEVPTRWNSAFAMVERILLIKESIFKVLLNTPKAPPVLTADEIEQLQDVCLLLEPFNTNTKIISGNQYVSLPQIIPISYGLHSIMGKLKSKMQTAMGSEMCSLLAEKIHQRLYPYELRSGPRLATLLDPRFKKDGFWSLQNSSQAFVLLENELSEINRAFQPINNNGEQSTSINEIPDVYEFLRDKISQKVRSNRADAIMTLREYFEKPNEPLSADPLEYWKCKTEEKSMQILARRYLCIPASSTESERVFSKAGELISQRRTRLKEKHVNMVLFTNKNYYMAEKTNAQRF